MNKAQKLLQPMVEAADKKFRHIIDGEGYDGGFTAGYSNGMDDAYAELATLPDAITLADVPAVEWEQIVIEHNTRPRQAVGFRYKHWRVYEPTGIDGMSSAYEGAEFRFAKHETAQSKRYVEIRIYLAALERKLLAELAGGA